MSDAFDDLFNPDKNRSLGNRIATEIELGMWPLRISDDGWFKAMMHYLIPDEEELSMVADADISFDNHEACMYKGGLFVSLRSSPNSPVLNAVLDEYYGEEPYAADTMRNMRTYRTRPVEAIFTLNVLDLVALLAGSSYATFVVRGDIVEVMPVKRDDTEVRRYAVMKSEKSETRIWRPKGVKFHNV